MEYVTRTEAEIVQKHSRVVKSPPQKPQIPSAIAVKSLPNHGYLSFLMPKRLDSNSDFGPDATLLPHTPPTLSNPKRQLQVSPRPQAEVLVAPHPHARQSLQDPPDVPFGIQNAQVIQSVLASYRKDPLPVVQRVPVLMMTIAHLPHEEHLAVLLPLLGRQRRGPLGAVHAHEASHAEFDEVAVQEEGLELLQVPRVGLKHRHPGPGRLVVASVVMLCFETMRDLSVIEGEGAEGRGERIFVAPAGAALRDEGVVVFGAVIIVVSAEAKGLRRRVSSARYRRGKR